MERREKMRLIDADHLIDLVMDTTILRDGFKKTFIAIVNGEPTVEPNQCKDIISRQAAIDTVAKYDFSFPQYTERFVTELRDAMKADIINDLVELPIVQSELKWIPCGEQLPKERQWVLCQCRAKIIDVLRLNSNHDWEQLYPQTTYMGGFVVAWMPLPEPYKED